MIGAVVYRLRALNSCNLSAAHGKSTHGACFHLLEEYNPELSAYIHDQMEVKPFTASLLLPVRQFKEQNGRWNITKGMNFRWRMTALQTEPLQAFLSLPVGTEIKIGPLRLLLESITADPEKEKNSGILEEDDLIASCLGAPPFQSITFNFQSVTSFRAVDKDFPFPTPDKIFGSLAGKWAALSMPGDLDPEGIRNSAAGLLPLQWEGQSRQIYLDRYHGVLGFTGRFAFDVSALPEEDRAVFLLLATYAEFAGTGRLTGQGLGQTRISIR